MNPDVFITCAVTGVGNTTDVSGLVPVTPEQIADAALEELKTAARDRDRVTDAVIAADIRFHQEIVRLAGSPRLSRAHETLVAETRMLLSHHPPYPWKDYVTDHVRLLEALEQGGPRAPDLVAEHLRLSARLIAEELSRASEDGADARGGTPRPGEEEERAVT